jgi:REP element-mobilizing transposase RayT
MRRKYSFYVCGYVVMPEHVHILLREPDRKTLAAALQSIKQKTFRLSPVFWVFWTLDCEGPTYREGIPQAARLATVTNDRNGG